MYILYWYHIDVVWHSIVNLTTVDRDYNVISDCPELPPYISCWLLLIACCWQDFCDLLYTEHITSRPCTWWVLSCNYLCMHDLTLPDLLCINRIRPLIRFSSPTAYCRGRNKDFRMCGQMAVHNDFCTDIFKFCIDIVPLCIYWGTTFRSDLARK